MKKLTDAADLLQIPAEGARGARTGACPSLAIPTTAKATSMIRSGKPSWTPSLAAIC